MTRYRLDSQFHCSYLESRGVPRKNAGEKTAGNYLPFISGDVISGDATSGDVLSGDATSGRACARDHFRHPHTAPPKMISGWCFYTTTVNQQEQTTQCPKEKGQILIYKTLLWGGWCIGLGFVKHTWAPLRHLATCCHYECRKHDSFACILFKLNSRNI